MAKTRIFQIAKSLNISHTDILSFLSSLGMNRIDLLVGHDAGSSVAGVSAMIRPDIFRSVVMMSAPYTGAPDIKTDLFIEDPIHYNLENLLAVIATGLISGISIDNIILSINSELNIPGRMEKIDLKNNGM